MRERLWEWLFTLDDRFFGGSIAARLGMGVASTEDLNARAMCELGYYGED